MTTTTETPTNRRARSKRSDWRTALVKSREKPDMPDSSIFLRRYESSLAQCKDTTGLLGTISNLAIAPIKAFGMLALDRLSVTETGLATECGLIPDRGLMIGQEVTGKPYRFTRFSQREEPMLALATPTWDGSKLTYSAPGMKPLQLYPDDFNATSNDVVRTKITSTEGDEHDLVPNSGKITAWIRDFLHRYASKQWDLNTIHVLHQSWNFSRAVEEQHACGTNAYTGLSDGGYMLVASSSTLKWMNEEIAKGADGPFEPLKMNAFRPNVVLDGLPANIEDTLSEVEIGDFSLKFGGLCVRCPVTMVDQETGKSRDDKQPLAWLAKNRPARPPKNTGVTFGVNCVLTSNAEDALVLQRGKTFKVLAEK